MNLDHSILNEMFSEDNTDTFKPDSSADKFEIKHDQHEEYMNFHYQHCQFLEEIKNLNETILFVNSNISNINKRIAHLKDKNEKLK